MEFPGPLGVGLFRLGERLRVLPLVALAPFFGIVGADIAVDVMYGRMGSVGVEVVVMPVFAMLVLSVARRPHPGLSGQLLLALGAISATGGTVLLTLGLSRGVAPVVVMGLRHLAVAAYSWAAIATEPPPRPRVRLGILGA